MRGGCTVSKKPKNRDDLPKTRVKNKGSSYWEDLPIMARLTEKQRKFVEEFNGNGTKAAAAAGYANPQVSAVQLLKTDIIREAIKKKAELEERALQEATKEAVKKRRVLTRLELQEFWSRTVLDESQDMTHRLRAAEALAKSKAMFIDRMDVTSKGKSLAELIIESIKSVKKNDTEPKTIDVEVVDAEFTDKKVLPE